MSKLGRYSADRKKIKALTASHTVTVAECGTIFTADPTAGSIVITLPACASAGEGWWCKVFRLNAHSNNVTVALNGSDAAIGVEVSNTAVAMGTASVVMNTTVAGIQAEFICDGTLWLVNALGVAAGDVT